jgi:hypothetical protein
VGSDSGCGGRCELVLRVAAASCRLNPGNKKSFLEICQLSDPAGRMIHWKGWLEQTPPPEPVPQPHPVYAFGQPVAVIDFATELECDCPTSGCKLACRLMFWVSCM